MWLLPSSSEWSSWAPLSSKFGTPTCDSWCESSEPWSSCAESGRKPPWPWLLVLEGLGSYLGGCPPHLWNGPVRSLHAAGDTHLGHPAGETECCSTDTEAGALPYGAPARAAAPVSTGWSRVKPLAAKHPQERPKKGVAWIASAKHVDDFWDADGRTPGWVARDAPQWVGWPRFKGRI